MEKTALLLEYLKEQYTQARQHETRQTNATTFLTAAAGAILGFVFKDGVVNAKSLWMGIVILGVGVANYQINSVHFKGNRFHTDLAGETRKELEKALGQ
jgi:hypothetical protein